MENLEAMIGLLYKRVSVQRVIEDKIKYDAFDKDEFIRMSGAYIFYYSENESRNLLNYFVDFFYESAKKDRRKLDSGKLNVFEPLFYCAQEFLLIHDNEILCHYSRLMEWRKMTTELNEEMIVAAFLAKAVSPMEIIERGFSWKNVIGHNNEQINAIMRRGVSENHSHLNGAAPIFQISWLSLMNNIGTSRFGTFLRSYDKNRRYTNVAYADTYIETSFYQKYLQAAWIRILLYCKLTGRRIRVGKYDIPILRIHMFLKFPVFRSDWRMGEMYFDYEMVSRVLDRRAAEGEKYISFRDVALLILESCFKNAEKLEKPENPGWEEVWRINPKYQEILQGTVGEYLLNPHQIKRIVQSSIGTDLPEVFLRILITVERVALEDMEILFTDQAAFSDIYEEKTLYNVKDILTKPRDLVWMQDSLQSLVDVLRLGDFEKKKGIPNIDYILNHLEMNRYNKENGDFIFSGERWLMYSMLREAYLGSQEYVPYFNLFYAYLLIKESVRSELILSNKNVGFSNFQKYQGRKGDLLADAIYKKEFTRLAVSNSLVSKNIRMIELRITPESDIEANRKKIEEMDALVLPDEKWKKMIFYTVHFIKSPDRPYQDTEYLHCRHYQKRMDIEREAYALAGLREQYPFIGERILGIDAAANEIGCRPEVFAPVFRFLKNHRCCYYTAEKMVKMPQLGTTYHVGEDFLDLADGLRAIEEAVCFLNLQSGDRLGHALALGVDVQEWYQGKRYRTALPIQDYLDNLVWLFHKLIEYDIKGFGNFTEWLYGQYSLWFGQIYKPYLCPGEAEKAVQGKEKGGKRQQEWDRISLQMDVGIFNYYYAWQMRGDDPRLYQHGYFDEDYYIERREEFLADFGYLKDLKKRKIPEAVLLYYMYHYNPWVRKEGAKTIEFPISSDYIAAVAEIQKGLQKKIAKMGIAVETNPSSNFMIGTFRQYDKHPIIHFYNKELIHDSEQLQECPQLSVSINTDDQGVFSTSLENEYAFMARALELASDRDGKPLYNRADIYDWLEKIRIMGNEQSFGHALEENGRMQQENRE